MGSTSLGRDSRPDSFFAHHGWLAPGIRLFRKLAFPAKSAWIAVLFLIPLLVLLFDMWQDSHEQVHTAQSELQGLAYTRPLHALIEVAQGRRLALMNGSDLAPWQNKVADAYAKLAAVEKALGSTLQTAQPYSAVDKAHAELMRQPSGADTIEAFLKHNEYIELLMDLGRSISDTSQLALDPELDTFHLMNYSVLYGPRQINNVTQLTAIGSHALTTGQKSTRENDLLTEYAGVLGFIDEIVENDYQKAIAVEGLKDPDAKYGMDQNDKLYSEFQKTAADMVLGDKVDGQAAIYEQMGNASSASLRALNGKLMDQLQLRLEGRIGQLQRAFYTKLGLAIASVALAFYMLLSFYKVMLGGLREVTVYLEQITQGILAKPPAPWGDDEAAHLMIVLRDMEANLRVIVHNTLEGAAHVNTASTEIASASNDLARRTEANASAIEETAATMTQISEAVQRTSDTVAGAADIVRSNADSAKRGGDVISQVVSTMQGINASSAKIADIISVIDGIAFQTNILALNAAVEAARAGEQGRGFAVVASEVRSLAGRSAEAAREIKTLIDASISQVEKGTQVVGQAGAAIGEIVDNAGHINRLMAEIVNAAKEQSLGVNQVGAAVQDLDQNTQQNAAFVEETATSAAKLSDQATRLSEEVSFFKLR